MARLFSQSRNYTPLDDSEEFEQDLSLNYIISDEDDDSQDHGRFSFSRIVILVKRLKIPRINFAYIGAKFGTVPEKSRKKVCDLVICFVCMLTVLSICGGLGYHAVFVLKPAIVIDKSYRAFRIPNHEASLNYGALQSAKKNHTSFSRMKMDHRSWLFGNRSVRSVPDESHYSSESKNRLQSSVISTSHRLPQYRRRKRSSLPAQSYPVWKMQVIFLTEKGENIFTKERLHKIHEIERQILTHDKFSEFCFKDKDSSIVNDPAVKAINGCAPLNSLLSYFFPSKDEKGNVFYDGLGENMDNIDSALSLAMTSNHFYYYVDDKVNSSNRKSQLLRTEVLFGAPLKGFVTPYNRRDEQSEMFKKFVVSYIDVLAKASTDDISVLYGGQEIFDYEVELTFWNDVKMAIYAFIAIFILMLILTSGSVWLTVWGLISISLSAPLAIYFYRVVFKIVGLGILNGAAAFVIIGIGVDDVFVFVNVFRQADHITDARQRTIYTIKTAGKATFFTSFTTASAFAANIASMIPAVHDFGLFMSLIVASCWFTVVFMMPPVLYIWYISFRKCETKIAQLLCWCVPSACCNVTLPSDIAHFMKSNHGDTGSQVSISREVIDEDDDVQMLSLDTPPIYVDDTEDEDLLHVDPDPLVLPEEGLKADGQMGTKLQALLYYGMAKPFIKARWIILVVSFVLFAASIGLMTQLKTSTKPPQFFKEDTNIQKLLDLKSKFSAIDTVRCNYCSAMYSIGKQKQTPLPRVIPTPRPLVASTTKRRTTTTTTTTIATTEPETEEKRRTQVHLTTKKPTTKDYRDHIITAPWQPADHTLKPPEPVHPVNHDNKDKPTPKSLPENFDACKDRDCSHPKERPLLESGATVYVVFGVKSFHWSIQDVGHVMSDNQGVLEFDSNFTRLFNFSRPQILDGLKQLCTLCKKIASNSHLVRNGSAQCLPMESIPYSVRFMLLDAVDECKDLPKVSYIYNNQQPAHALGGLTNDGSAILWLGFAFESKTSKSQSYFESYKEYLQWEDYLTEIKQGLDPNSPLRDMFQTSEFWPEVLMEIVAVNSAIYGVVLSMVICMVAVMLFTRHVKLLLVIFISISEMVCLVVGIFYVLGWEIGGVEAVSLSILVGSSVDYCVHLVEGYILAAAACPVKDDATKARHWRTCATFSHIGVSVISSALTTIIAALPLTQTTIQPFAKFGQIIAINTSVCILYSLTVCTALLSTLAPAYFNPTWKSTLKSIFGTAFVMGIAILVLFVASKMGINIPGPNGGSLF